MRMMFFDDLGFWQLSDMEEAHLELLGMVAGDASMGDGAGRGRLFPSPLSGGGELGDEGFLEDWGDYVTGELEMQFAQDVGVVMADLDEVEEQFDAGEGAEGAEGGVFVMRVPVSHARAWFSALNQARLMLDAVYGLHPDGENLEVELGDGSLEDGVVDERLGALVRYEFYALIQEWLVSQVMDVGEGF